MDRHSNTGPKVILTVSCPLELFIWLKQTKRNVSAFAVEAMLAKKEGREPAAS